MKTGKVAYLIMRKSWADEYPKFSPVMVAQDRATARGICQELNDAGTQWEDYSIKEIPFATSD